MRQALAATLLLLAVVAPRVGASGADFTAATSTRGDVLGAAADFNTVGVSLADPGTPLHGSVALAATATSERGIATVRFQRAPAGGSTWSDICTASTAPYTCTWSTGAVADGAYDLRAVATDAAGYARTSLVTGRTVDNTGPAVTLADPGSPLRGTVALSATATDPAGVASVQFQRRVSPSGAWTNIGAADTSAPFSASWSTTGVTDGTYDLQAVATDTLGNTSTSVVSARVVDNTAPVPQAIAATNGTGTPGKIDAGDHIVFTFSEALQPSSVMSGWSGAAGAAVVVTFTDNNNADSFRVYGGTGSTQTRLTTGGAVAAKALVSAGVSWNGTIAASGGTYTITLTGVGTGSASSSASTNSVALSWPATAGFLDLAGNASLSRTVSGSTSAPF
jgi:hypothetical protein